MQYMQNSGGILMKQFTVIIERCPQTHLYFGYVPGLPGAYSKGTTIEALKVNMQEVIEKLLEANVEPEREFVGTQLITVH
jgi:predicted RNase H-like HicB family nuclease